MSMAEDNARDYRSKRMELMPPYVLTRFDHGVETVLQRSDDLDRLLRMRDQNREDYEGWAGFRFTVSDEKDPERGEAEWCERCDTFAAFEGELCAFCDQGAVD